MRTKPKTPTSLKIATATAEKRKKLLLHEPPAKIADIKCPKDLTGWAKKEWDRVAPLLRDMGLLAEIDKVALAVYCSNYELWREASSKLRKEGLITKPHGRKRISPYVRIISYAQRGMKQFAAEFGMTPSSRSGMDIRKTTKGNDGRKTAASDKASRFAEVLEEDDAVA